jgi:hypothetical protein
MPTLDDLDDEQKAFATLIDERGPAIIPSGESLTRRAAKTDFALGEASPGVDRISDVIAQGSEGEMRQAMAADDDLETEQYRNQILMQMAAKTGGNLSQADVDLVRSINAQELKSDPADAIEKRFSERWLGQSLMYQDELREEDFRAAHQATNLNTDIMKLHTVLEDLNTKYDNSGFLTKVGRNIEQMVPFLPWYRQANALDRPGHGNLSMGDTMKDNVQSFWLTPPEKRMQVLNDSIKKFEDSGRYLDAITFVQSLISFSASDEFLANAVSAADYASLGSGLWKLGSKIFGKAAKTAVTNVGKDVAEEAAAHPPGEPPVPPGGQQLDLFPDEQPFQGSFRFMYDPDNPGNALPVRGAGDPPVSPTGLVRDPKSGRMMRATTRDSLHPNGVSIPHNTPEVDVNPATGVFRGQGGRFGKTTENMTQSELGLEDTTDLFRGSPRTEAEKFAETPKSKPPEGGYQSGVGVVHADKPDLKKALADRVAAVADPKATPREILSRTGQVASSGILGALKLLKGVHSEGLRELASFLPTFANPVAFWQGSAHMGSPFALKAAQLAERDNSDLIRIAHEASRPTRLPGAALEVAKRETETKIAKTFETTLQNGALTFEYLPSETNPWRIDTMIGWVGNNKGVLFGSRNAAEQYAKDVYHLTGEYMIDQTGDGFRIGVFKHIQEDTKNVVDAMLGPNNAAGGGIVKAWLRHLVGADTLLSDFQSGQRKVATHGMNAIKAAIKERTERDLNSLSKKEKAGLERVLVENRDGPSKTNPSQRGFWHDTAVDFEKAYLRLNGHGPSDAVTQAYDTFRRMSDAEYLWRNWSAYRDLARRGVVQHQFTHVDSNGKSIVSGWFNGALRDEMPWNMGKADQDAGVYVYDSATKTGTFKYKFDFLPEEKKALDQKVANGWKVVQIADPRSHPIHGQVFGKSGDDIKDQINFVITNTWESKPLSWQQVEYRAGGHSIYKNRFWVAQPVIQKGRNGKWTFIGDNNALSLSTEVEARTWAGRMDTLREMLRAGSGWSPEAEAFRLSHLAAYSKDDIEHLMMRPGSAFNLKTPILYRRSGVNTVDEHSGRLQNLFPDFVDSTKSPYDLTNQMDKSFLMDRDNVVPSIVERGGLTRIAPAEQLSPFQALNQAMGQAMRNLGMADYKMSAAQSFIKEFGDVMDVAPEKLRAHPIYWLYNPDWNKQAYDRTKLALAKAQQQAIVSFLGHQTDLGHDISHLKDKLANVVYGVGGQRAVNALGLATEKDPVAFFRGVAFHTNLGLFNPVQMVMQAQSLNHVIAVAGPKNGISGTAAAIFMRALYHNPEHVEAAAKKLRVFGWKAEDFVEMHEAFKNSGIYHVGAEVATRDDIFDPKLFQTIGGRFLDKGAMFFNEGERIVRLAAFATAYKEWKAGNKLVKLGERDVQGIMNRADLLSVNMTRASSSAWQKGILSIPTQFFAFNARLLEQFVGGRLTAVEKARAMGWYSMMYGIPATAGIYTMGTSPIPGVPTSYDDIMKYAMRNGIDLSPTYLQALHSGVLSVITDAIGSAIAGKEKHYNAAERFGPGTQTALSGLLRDDKSWWDIVAGASGTILGDIAKAAEPYVYTAASVFTGSNNEYRPTTNDALTVLRNIKSFDNVMKAKDIIQYGQWITKNGVVTMDGVDGVDAAMVQAGLSPKEVTNTYLRQSILKEDNKNKGEYAKEAMDSFRKGMKAMSEGETGLADTYFARGRYVMDSGDFTWADRANYFRQAIKQNTDLATKTRWDLVKKSPASQQSGRLDEFIRGSK